MGAEWGSVGASGADWVDGYLLAKAGCEKDFKAEWEWWRYRVGGKMFAATMRPGPEHNPAYAGRRLLTLKCDPVWSEQLRAAYGDILPGFYMDKRTWISVDLDGAVPAETLRELCDHSYNLVFGGPYQEAPACDCGWLGACGGSGLIAHSEVRRDVHADGPSCLNR